VAWAEAVGERIAAAAEPVEEAADVVVIACVDPVWAEELDLMQEQLLARLRERLGEESPDRLRFRAGDP
jgi:predicted nucleic acid-binding Zn ribbon protein